MGAEDPGTSFTLLGGAPPVDDALHLQIGAVMAAYVATAGTIAEQTGDRLVAVHLMAAWLKQQPDLDADAVTSLAAAALVRLAEVHHAVDWRRT